MVYKGSSKLARPYLKKKKKKKKKKGGGRGDGVAQVVEHLPSKEQP
jgi:hypothetical protein